MSSLFMSSANVVTCITQIKQHFMVLLNFGTGLLSSSNQGLCTVLKKIAFYEQHEDLWRVLLRP